MFVTGLIEVDPEQAERSLGREATCPTQVSGLMPFFPPVTYSVVDALPKVKIVHLYLQYALGSRTFLLGLTKLPDDLIHA